MLFEHGLLPMSCLFNSPGIQHISCLYAVQQSNRTWLSSGERFGCASERFISRIPLMGAMGHGPWNYNKRVSQPHDGDCCDYYPMVVD